MRSNNVNLIDAQYEFKNTYNEKEIAQLFIECGFFPQILLKPMFDHLLEVGGVASSRVHSSFHPLMTFNYYFKNQLAMWDTDKEQSIHDGYLRDITGNHVYFQLVFADTIRGENIIQFGMENKAAVPQKIKKYVAKMRRDAKAANLEITRVAKEYYALPVGVAQGINEEFGKFFNEVKTLLLHDNYTAIEEKDGFSMMSMRESARRGCVFVCQDSGLIGKIWLKNNSYLSGRPWPGQIELTIMFEDEELERKVSSLATEIRRRIETNAANVMLFEREKLVRKLRGENIEFSFKCSEIEGFKYNV